MSRLKELASEAKQANKQEFDSLKQAFYKLHNAELETAKKLFTEEGGAEEDYAPKADAVEE